MSSDEVPTIDRDLTDSGTGQADSGPGSWFLAGVVAVCLALVLGLFLLFLWQGGTAFWPDSPAPFWEKVQIYFSNWRDALTGSHHLTAGGMGLLSAVWGTIALSLLMMVFLLPMGMLTALYLHQNVKPGLGATLLRIALTNLACTPSIVYGVLGLGLFWHLSGGSGRPGLIWASTVLAWVSLPVMVIAAEQALVSVPKSLRIASAASGANQWQTLHRVVLPLAWPGILTGVILSLSRGTGAVAPLLLLGLSAGHVPGARDNPGVAHLGVSVWQETGSPSPMLYVSALLLLLLVTLLHVLAVRLRSRIKSA